MESQLALQLMGDGGSDQPDGKAGKCKFLAFYNWQIALPSWPMSYNFSMNDKSL